MKLLSKIKYEVVCRYVIYVVLSFLFSLICYRAFSLSLTHDEAITFSLHSSAKYIDILQYNAPIASNNHLANTILIKIFTQLLGNSEFIIRLPSVLGGLMYLLSSFFVVKILIDKNWKRLLSIIILCGNPFIIDFLSCARGYGLALGFMMLSILFILLRQKEKILDFRYLYTFLSIFFAACTVLSNLSFLNFFLGVSFVVGVSDVFSLLKKPTNLILNFIKITFPHIIHYLLLFVILYGPVTKMQESGEFYFGGERGFWEDTVLSLINSFWADKSYATLEVKSITSIFIIFTSIAILYVCIKILFHKDKSVDELSLLQFTGLIIIPVLSVIAQNRLMGTLFVVGRAAIFFIPLFLLTMLSLWLSSNRRIIHLIFIFVLSIISFHHILSLNWSYYNNWKYDSSNKQLLHDILYDSENKEIITIGITWLYEPSLNYYIHRDFSGKIEKVDRSGVSKNYDYYYVSTEDKHLLEKRNVIFLKYYSTSDSYLFKSTEL